MNNIRFLIVASAALVLAGCGDSPSEDVVKPDSSNKVPTSATVSVTSYTDFVAASVANSPLDGWDVQEVKPPTSETALPAKVN